MNLGYENGEARGTSARKNSKLNEDGVKLDWSIIEEESNRMCEALKKIADEQRQGLTENSDDLARPRAQGQQRSRRAREADAVAAEVYEKRAAAIK